MIIAPIMYFMKAVTGRQAAIAAAILTSVFCFMTTGSVATTYYNVANSSSLQNTNQWGVNTDGSGSHPSNFTHSGDVFNIYNGTSTAIGGNWALGTVTINVGNGSAAMSFTQNNFTATATATINVLANSTYTIKNATMPTLGTLDTSSTVVYSGTATYTIPADTFGNLTYSSSGAGSFTAGSITVVAGDFSQTAGTLTLATSSSTTNLTVQGDASFTGGSLNFCSGSGSGGHYNINVAQNLTIGSSYSVTTSGSVNNGAFIFNGSGTAASPQVFSVSATGAIQWANFTVNSGTYVQLAGSVSTINITGSTTTSPSDYRGTVTVNGTLDAKNITFTPSGSNSVITVNSGATVITQNANGLGGSSGSGLFNTTNWTASFSGGANYIYNGTAAQVTGTYLPASMTAGGDVTINNGAGVTLSQATTIGATDTLNLISGTFINGTNLTMNSGSTVMADSSTFSATPATYSGVTLVYANLGANATTVTTGNEFPASFTGNVIINKPGSIITLNNAKTLTGNLTISAGSLDASTSNYNLSFTGTWTNNSGTSAFTGRSATVICNGSSAQTIGGTYSTTFNSLTINNSMGVSLGIAANVNGTLTLTSGRLNIASYNLTLGASSPAVAGTLSSSNMIVANGGGSVRKTYSANGSYLFPIGDNTPTYSPITLNVSGSAYSGATAGVNVTKAKHPNNANVSNYLNRYWSVSLAGITSPSCTVTAATYVTGDVTGTEASISAGEYPAALPWVKFGTTNTSTHTLTTTAITRTAFDISGITTAAPTVSSSANTTICSGNSATLTASSGTGDPTLTYTWSPATSLSVTTGTSVTASPAATTVYTLTITDGNGFTGSATTQVSVNPAPVAITGTNVFCMPSTTMLNETTSGGTWSSSNTGVATVGTSGIVTGVASGNATISYTMGSACYVTMPVTVSAAPTAAPTNNSPICNASAVNLTANPGGSTNTYTWSGPSLSSSTAANPTATPSVTSTYSLTASYGTAGTYPGCTSTVYTTSVTVRSTGYWLGSTSTAWATAANWCGGVPTATTDVLIPSGATYNPSVTTGTNPSRNLTIQSGGSLTLSGGTLQIAGIISNSGTFTASSGSTIEVNGSAAQTVPASTFASNTIANLTITNSAGVTLGGTLKVSGIVKVNSGTLTTGGYLTLLSTSSQTALVDGSGAGTISGNVTMQRYFDSSYGYKYISSPFVAATLGQLSSYVNFSASFPQFYYYNENVNYAGWVIDTAAADTIKPLWGYAANFGTAFTAKTISLTGAVNNGTQSTTLYNHNQTYTQGFNLIGNPYPSPIDWNASSGWTKTNIDNAIYYFNAGDTNQYYGTYDSYVGGVSSDGLAANIIPAMQGFFVHVSSGSYPVTGTLSVTNSVRTTNLSPYYHKHTSSVSDPLIRIAAGYETSLRSDPAVVYFNDSADYNFDNSFDAIKLMNTAADVPNLYAVSADNKNLSIQGLPLPADTMRLVPLGLQLPQDGWVDFNTRDLANLPAGMHVWFYDTKTGASQDLLVNPKYRVYLGAGKYENRFFLFLSAKEKINIPGVNGELNAYASGKNLVVFVTYGTGHLVVTDMAGRVVERQDLDGTGYHTVTLNVANGIYIATLYSEMGKQSKKIFLGNE